jgi:hypothetical protein
MKRIHAFEWEDFRWFPAAWRDYGTSYLQFIATRFDIYNSIVPIIEKGLAANGNASWLDCASGGGGGLVNLYKAIVTKRPDVTLTLTDLYPNAKAFEQTQTIDLERISFESQSVDATQLPQHLKQKFRTMFGAFHHMDEASARKILQQAVDDNTPIAIFEPLSRNVPAFISMLFVPLNVWLLTPFIRPVRWQVFPFIYLIPIVPLYILWDGVVSILRMYSKPELEALIKGLKNSENFFWEIGEKGSGPMKVQYLYGEPRGKKD